MARVLAPPTKRDSVINIDQSVSPTVSKVEQHNQEVRQRGSARVCYREFCARCLKPAPFSPHDLRDRGLRVIVNDMVMVLTVWLARWRCRRCRYVFTDYPDFRTPLQALRLPDTA